MAISNQLTPKEVAQIMNLSEKTIKQMASKGEPPAKKIRKHWRFDESAIQEFLRPDNQQQRRESESARLIEFATSLRSKSKGDLAMSRKKSRLPDRLNLGNYGYYKVHIQNHNSILKV